MKHSNLSYLDRNYVGTKKKIKEQDIVQITHKGQEMQGIVKQVKWKYVVDTNEQDMDVLAVVTKDKREKIINPGLHKFMKFIK